ncbi:phosphohistidine phosphatase [Rickettsiales bacterium Ac37b]|nr:phosphohistidine phosphatase [Rickettsiales bacterium Ac37b]
MKHIWIMRHATAENASKDYDRKLAEKGTQEAIKAAEFLNKSGTLPELILASSASRTRETAAYIKQNMNNNVDIEFIDELYRADMNRILQQLQKVNERYQAVILIAHNPGVYEFSMEFIKENQALLKATVPASIAYFTVECNLWSLLDKGQGSLRWFFMP